MATGFAEEKSHCFRCVVQMYFSGLNPICFLPACSYGQSLVHTKLLCFTGYGKMVHL